MNKYILVMVFMFVSCGVAAETASCPKNAELDKLLKFGDLFIGELHGTNEAPEFYRCLIDRALQTSKERVIVSLELEDDARSALSAVWKKTDFEDGRSSKAMFNLVRYLVEKESMAILNLHFQHRARTVRSSPEVVGKELNELSERGLLIAIAGNAHTPKVRASWMSESMLSEGMFVGPKVTHIILETVHKGTLWACIPQCGIQVKSEIPRFAKVNAGDIQDGKEFGHDFMYFIDHYSASEPMDMLTPTVSN
ncbi:MAG TPA: hypothetical protein PK002_09840 [Cellvibrio sp.]|nr:hypothetical protein [Cellvibrio sp.]